MIDFQELGKYRENNRIEAKRAVGGLPRSIWETYSAFANTVGGVILLGVEEGPDKTLHSVRLPDPEGLAEEFLVLVNDPAVASVNILSPMNVCVIEAEGNRIVVIEVPRADRRDRPVYVGGDPVKGTYRRNGEGDYHCTLDEVRAMQRDSREGMLDGQILSALPPSSLSAASVERYRKRLAAARPEHPWLSLPWDGLCAKLGALARGEDRFMHPTAAGLLLFGEGDAIRSVFPHYALDYQERPSRTSRWTYRLRSEDGAWSGNLFDFYERVTERLPLGLPEEEHPQETREAITEALVNAIVHADYEGTRSLSVVKTPCEIVFSNPGGLRPSLPEALGGGVADPRNANIMRILRLAGIGHGEGSGLPAIFRAWKKRNRAAPVLEEQLSLGRTVLTLPLYGKPDAENTGVLSPAVRQAALDYLRDHVSAELSELADFLGEGTARVKLLLGDLIAGGLAEEIVRGGKRLYRLKQ